MLRLLGFFIVAAVLMFGAAWIFDNDNPLQIRWFDGQVYDWSLAWLIVAGLTFALAAVVVYELLRIVLGYPTRWWRKRQVNRQLEGLRTVTRGMMAVAAGDGTQAKELKREAEKLLGEREPAALLLAAQAAELDDNHEVAQLKYRQMLRQRSTALLGLRGLLHDALATGDMDQALELARRAYREYPYTEWVVQQLFDLLVHHQLWSEALRRVDDLKLNRVVDAAEAQRLRGRLKFLLAQKHAEKGELEQAFKSAMDATRRQRAFAPAAAFASELANRLGKTRRARSVIEESWARAPHPQLVEAYAALAPDETASARYGRFERLYSRNANHHLTQRIMIEAALAAGETGRARSLVRDVPGTNPTAGTLQTAIDALKAVEPDSPRIAEFEALLADAPADEAWVCQRTGQVVPRWQPFGPTGEFDTLRWQSPPKVATFVAAAPSGAFGRATMDLEASAVSD
ncbi:MAG: heme biosynthesis protein HemY [Alphaproteobacteria bacterium]